MTEIAEGIAKELTSTYRKNEDAGTEFGKNFKNIFDTTLKSRIKTLASKNGNYQLKLVRSIFLTRWYWQMKINKTQKRLGKYERILKKGLV